MGMFEDSDPNDLSDVEDNDIDRYLAPLKSSAPETKPVCFSTDEILLNFNLWV